MRKLTTDQWFAVACFILAPIITIFIAFLAVYLRKSHVPADSISTGNCKLSTTKYVTEQEGSRIMTELEKLRNVASGCFDVGENN